MIICTNIQPRIDAKKVDERKLKEYIAKQNTSIDNLTEEDINKIYNSLIYDNNRTNK